MNEHVVESAMDCALPHDAPHDLMRKPTIFCETSTRGIRGHFQCSYTSLKHRSLCGGCDERHQKTHPFKVEILCCGEADLHIRQSLIEFFWVSVRSINARTRQWLPLHVSSHASGMLLIAQPNGGGKRLLQRHVAVSEKTSSVQLLHGTFEWNCFGSAPSLNGLATFECDQETTPINCVMSGPWRWVWTMMPTSAS